MKMIVSGLGLSDGGMMMMMMMMMMVTVMKKIVRRLGMSVVAETVLYICISVLELTTETRVCATLPRLSHLCTGRVHLSLRCGLQSCHISSHYSLIISS